MMLLVRSAASAGTLLLCAAGMLAPAAGVSQASVRMLRSRERPWNGIARSARDISVMETASFLPVGNVGVKVLEQGNGRGTLIGSVWSRLSINGIYIAGTFTFKSQRGTISGTTTANIVGQAARPVVSFVGSLSVSSGTGTYAHASGRLSVAGNIRRRNYALTETVSGKLHL